MANATNRQYAPPMSQQSPPSPEATSPTDWPEIVFARRMKRERTRRGWSQERLAREVNEEAGPGLELHPTAITKLEREGVDRRNLRLNEAIYISGALGITLMRMLSDDDQSDTETSIHELELKLAGARESQAHAETQMRSASQLAAEYARELVAQKAEAALDLARMPEQHREQQGSDSSLGD